MRSKGIDVIGVLVCPLYAATPAQDQPHRASPGYPLQSGLGASSQVSTGAAVLSFFIDKTIL